MPFLYKQKSSNITAIELEYKPAYNTYSFEMILFIFLCDEVVSVIRVLVLTRGLNANAWK